MGQFKYNPGDRLGPDKILFLSRDYTQGNGNWIGTFECPICKKPFQSRIKAVSSGTTRSCGNHHLNVKDLTGQIIGNLKVISLSNNRKDWIRDAVWNVQCIKCGQEFEIVASKLHRGDLQECTNLHGQLTNGGRPPQNLIGQRFGHLTVIEYLGNRMWKCQCDCHENAFTTARTDSLLSGTKISCGCIHSKGEDKIAQLLHELHIQFEQQKTFDTCRFLDTNALAKFDFYLPEYNLLIEYNGSQHYMYRNTGWNTEEQMKKTQDRDEYKIQWAKENNISLIIIPYTDFNILTKDYLLKLLK